MPTPTEILLKMMPPAVAAGKEALDKANRVGGAVNRAQNPLTPGIIAAPAVKKGLETAGGVLNNNAISQQLDDPIVKGLAAMNPLTGLALGAAGVARGFNSQSKVGKPKPTSSETKTNKPAEKPVVTGPNGEVLTADPNNPGFLLTPGGKSVRGDLTGGKGPVSADQGTGYPTLSTTGPQRSVPDPAGTGAKGTQTGFQGYEIDLGIAEKSLGREIADINSFLSENLPVVGYRDQGGREIRPTGDDLSELQGSYADGLISKDQLIFEGISTPGKNGVSPADVADNKRSVRIPGDMDDMDPMSEATGGADDDDFGGPDPEDYATNYSARRTAQRNGFLDPSITNSVTAVRNSNSKIGRLKIGGDHYFNDGGTLRKVTKEAYEKQGSTGLSTEELKGAFVDSIKETLVPVATADAFDVGETAITNAKQTTADYMGDIAETEFNMNNVAPGQAALTESRSRMKDNYFSKVYDTLDR